LTKIKKPKNILKHAIVKLLFSLGKDKKLGKEKAKNGITTTNA
jgi:hypothetical protein